jgi:hypothetical protein
MRLASKHGLALRFSLLAALGALPAACGGRQTDGGPVGGEAGTGGGKQTGTPETCTNPQLDPMTQLVTCAEGYRHRPQSVACRPEDGSGAALPQGGGSGVPMGLPRATGESCTGTPEVCDAYQYGFCQQGAVMGGPDPVLSICLSGCVVDADCGAGNICACGYPSSPTGGVCEPSECQTDDDCQPGYLCASYRGGCAGDGFACQTPNDTCTYEMCTGLQSCKPVGAADGHRECQGVPVCGRPFLVEAMPRIAPVTAGSAWQCPLGPAPRLEHLTQSERAEQAAHWTRMGQMEHASIAAFARFSLQLLALGAPPELIESCNAALADETAHTRLCFQLASAYAGEWLSPGPLDVTGSVNVTALADVVDLVLAEGCLGETGAALEALELADAANDPVIREAYARIARDEERHAALAFRFLRWALARDPLVVAKSIRAARGSLDAAAPQVRDVVKPCLDALLMSSKQSAQA